MSIDWGSIVDLETLIGWLLTRGVRILVVIVVALIAVRLGAFITRRVEQAFEDDDPTIMSEREKQAATLGKVVRSLVRIVVWGIALLVILREVGIEIGPILAGAGVVGLAVGFGAQSLVKDFLSGMFVLIENQYQVGDVVRIGGVQGIVEKLTLRATTLRDLNGDVHMLPNGSIDLVTNMTRQFSRYILDIGVAYKENVDEVMALLKELGEEMAADPAWEKAITAPMEVLGLEEFGDSAVVIRVRFTTAPIRQWDVAREFRRRVKNAFDARGIEIPFPHQTIYLGEAAPMGGILKVRVDEPDRGSVAG
ncbi:MAG: mechanosensitive ion channel family protein [Deltaproteobacteria bacterium]|nr:mechanosensitive ion channel family protein [Deltaproteobacteria bacterium]